MEGADVKRTEFADRPTFTSREVRAGCFVCGGSDAIWIGGDAQAVESGISVFEDEFLANIVLPSGESAGDWMRPQIAEAYRIGTMPALLPMLPSPSKGDRSCPLPT